MDIFLYCLKHGDYKLNQQFILDQGPIFYTILLMTEFPNQEEQFLKKIEEILPYYDNIIYLEAPLPIIYQRINSREQKHRVKDVDESIQRAFLEKHATAFNKILALATSKGVKVHRIDTDKNSIEIVQGMANVIIKS
jgi:thymidylate kinase